jgi:hypothetical protein
VLKNIPVEVHCGQHVWCQNLISVSSGETVVVNVHQLCLGVGYGIPHHHTSSAEIVDPLIPAFSFLQHES